MTDTVTHAADALERRLRAVGTPERAEGTKAYLKSELEFLGTTVWQIRSEVKAVAKAQAALTHDELVARSCGRCGPSPSTSAGWRR